MPFPQVIAVAAGSAAAEAGVAVGDEIRSMNGAAPRDIIEFRLLADEAELDLELGRGGLDLELHLEKVAGEPLGVEVSSPLFDRVRTCDNHCEFCFIYQLPKHLRRSLYVKDDDYRLSFLYGNFTTLTRFTELDLDRVVEEGLSPLYVSIHATDPEVRARMLRNRRGATSLRWLRRLLDHGIEVHGQIVCCPGVNDGAVLESTLAGILERFPELASAAVVPLGVSRYTTEPAMRPHTAGEAKAVLQTVRRWQAHFRRGVGRRLVHAADEYYLLAGEAFPAASVYEAFPQVENGVGMAAEFIRDFRRGRSGARTGGGFFASVDGAPPAGYRARRNPAPTSGGSREGPIHLLTGTYGAAVLRPLLAEAGRTDVRVVAVPNDFFGGNIGVAGLLTGVDVARAMRRLPRRARLLLPDVCLSEGRFLDDSSLEELPGPVEVVPSTGEGLRAALEAPRRSLLPVAVGAAR